MAHEHAAHPPGGPSADGPSADGPSHAGHAHRLSGDADRRRLAGALALISTFMAAEVAAAVISRSLALLSDAGHMLTDAAAIGMSLLAVSLAARPPRGALTFGLRRAEILSALANGVTLLILAVLIAYEAVRRLFAPPTVHGWLVLAVALVGMLVNVLAAWLLAGAARRSLNVEGSLRHVMSDLYGFIGTAIAAAVILASGFQRADPIASLFIAALMTRSGVALVRDSARVFLEAAPKGLDPQQIGRALVSEPGVVEVHDLHVWEVTSGFPALSAHVLVGAESDCHAARRGIEALLHERFGVDHTTLQVDHAGSELLAIAPSAAPRHAGDSRKGERN
ncbi:MAG TPA: cation diffusion facilitator family transporter [Solirubrobacteraceae bacterium]|nr:cation diffusion facilitator family transporter [Solirubrobacteraceae bacterium]